MTDRELLDELQYILIEPPDGGDSWPSLIWTRDEVLDAINAGLRALVHDTHLHVTRVEIAVPAGTTEIDLPTDWLATAHLVWRAEPGYANTILADGPVQYWRLDEIGAVAVDEISALNAAVSGGVTPSIAGVTDDGNAAMRFDGISGSVVPVGTYDVGTAWTIEAWVQRSSLPANFEPFWSNGSFVSGMLKVGIYLTGEPQAHWVGALPSSLVAPVFAPAFTLNTWHHVVATHDGTTTTLYFNGAYLDSALQTGVIAVPNMPGCIGFEPNGLAYWTGDIDEVAIYDYALTAAQVLAHYAAVVTPAAGLTYARTPLGPVDAFEGDLALPGWEVDTGLPLGYADLDGPTLTIRLVPTPEETGVLELLYIAHPTPLAPVIADTAIDLPIADEFASALKYAALGSLLRKVGRLIDAERAAYCERRYELTKTVAGILLEGWS